MMYRSILVAALVGWISRRMLALGLAVVSAWMPVSSTPRWVGCLGGGGGARIERTLELARRHPSREVYFVGSGPEVAFARSLAEEAPGVRARYLTVEPATTHACLVALQRETRGHGVLVTSASHASRVRLTWSLHSLSPDPPGIVATGRAAPDALEMVKVLYYLARY